MISRRVSRFDPGVGAAISMANRDKGTPKVVAGIVHLPLLIATCITAVAAPAVAGWLAAALVLPLLVAFWPDDACLLSPIRSAGPAGLIPFGLQPGGGATPVQGGGYGRAAEDNKPREGILLVSWRRHPATAARQPGRGTPFVGSFGKNRPTK